MTKKAQREKRIKIFEGSQTTEKAFPGDRKRLLCCLYAAGSEAVLLLPVILLLILLALLILFVLLVLLILLILLILFVLLILLIGHFCPSPAGFIGPFYRKPRSGQSRFAVLV